MIDTQRAHLVPMLRAVSNFVHNGQARDVESVMVDGQWLMRDGKVLTMDEPAIIAAAQEVSNKAWSRQFHGQPQAARRLLARRAAVDHVS